MINNKKLKLAAPLGFFLKLIFGAISFGSALKYVMPTYWSYAVNTDPFVKFGFYLSVAAIIGYNYLLPLYEKNGTPQQIKSVIYLLRFLLLFGATATAYGISQTKLNDADYVANEGKKGNTNYVKNAAKKGLETKKKTPPSLHILIEKGLLHTIADRIKSANSIELNALDSLGRTPLGLAVAMGDLYTTIALLSNKNTDLVKPTFFVPKSVTGKAVSILSEKKEFIKTPLN